MLTYYHRAVSLALFSVDLPVWSVVEAAGTLYQRDSDRFHLLLTEPSLNQSTTPRLLWLEISPYRVVMTMQGDGKLSYRHFWERGVCGISRYWLSGQTQIALRNYTYSLSVRSTSAPTPVLEYLHLEYELRTNQMQLGRYVLDVSIRD
ncbi:hypothetical protein H6F94_10355 [Leptolyngbya sp. FACHB-261]|nr:hypothetical protein [Leptolyngbya sp. FACHB-261]